MSEQLIMVKDKVQRYLTDDFLNRVEIDSDGDFTARHGSSRLFIRVIEQEERERTLVAFTVPLLLDVPPSPDLYKHIALHSDDYFFGRLSLVERDGKCDVIFDHVLLGDYLDPDELKDVVGTLLGVADEIDDELQKMFGGKRFHDDTESS